MTKTKYFLKEKCALFHEFKNPHHISCICKGKGFIRGSDVTELIERILSKIPQYHWKKLLGDLIEVVDDD